MQNLSAQENDAMNRRQPLICYVLIVCSLAVAWAARAAEKNTGDWTIRRSEEPGKVHFALMTYRDHGTSNHESDWPVSAFQGLDLGKPGKQDVSFKIVRDAGRFECKGYLEDGEGAGIFHFFPDPNYAREMSSLGFSGVDDDKQFAMAVMDVSLDFAKQMKAEHLQGLDTDKLIAFRIFNVTPEFIEAFRREGLPVSDSDKLVAFRIHGVSPEMVRYLLQAGYKPDEDTLIAMRIHGATPEWMDQLSKVGYGKVDLEKLIAFRIHGVSPEFIQKLQGLGYAHPDPDQLVAMRIHGVTPDYISGLRARGMKDLSIDQLVSLRIHGIN
jgi:hypothetical protein